MKAIILANGVGSRVSSPEIELAEELARQGHEVLLGLSRWQDYKQQYEKKHPLKLQLGEVREDGKDYVLSKQLVVEKGVDVIYSTCEGLTDVAQQLAMKHNCPYGSHFEWIPPWRTGTDPQYWGETPLTPEMQQRWLHYYQDIVGKLAQAPFVTTCHTTLIPNLLNFLATIQIPRFDLLFRHYHVDPAPFQEFQEWSLEEQAVEQARVLTISRLVPMKRIQYLMSALAFIKERTGEHLQLRIIGEGPALQQLQNYAVQHQVEVEFLGAFSGSQKYHEIAEAEMLWGGWTNSIAEGFLAGKPAVSFLAPGLVENFGNLPSWVNWNSVEGTAIELLYLHNNPEKRKELGRRAQHAIKHRHCNVWLLEDATKEFAQKLEKMI